MKNKIKIARQYLNEFHRKTTLASLEEVERLQNQSFSWEEMSKQTKRKTKNTDPQSRR